MKLIEGGWPAGTTIEPTLPGEYYATEEIFERELDRIWFDTWLLAGRADELTRTGDFFLRAVGGESVIVVRNHDGRVSAFYNVCRHRGSRLCTDETGTLKSAAIRCPY